jgi:multiple sugar transport system ATP-binding protein
MNFMPATLEHGMLRANLGDVPLTDQMRRALEANGSRRDVILGLRPENFEDAALIPDDLKPAGVTFPVSADVVESMGSDVFVYFTLEGASVQSQELAELAHDSGRTDTGADSDHIVARLDPTTSITEGQTADLWADARSIYVFDPGSGANLALGTTATTEAA